MRIVLPAAPIRPGFPHLIVLPFDPELFDLLFRAPVLLAHFRPTISGPLLCAVDTTDGNDDGTISRAQAAQLQIALSASATANLRGLSRVVFDFVGIEADTHTPIPGLYAWPVQTMVTRDVQ